MNRSTYLKNRSQNIPTIIEITKLLTWVSSSADGSRLLHCHGLLRSDEVHDGIGLAAFSVEHRNGTELLPDGLGGVSRGGFVVWGVGIARHFCYGGVEVALCA
jgi:hypothetical protein